MNVSGERTRSLWMDTEVARAVPLGEDVSADVVIVGSGIAGLSTAYELAGRGLSVVVLDRGPIGKGMTSRTTAHLTSLCDDSFDSLISRRGLDVAKTFFQSQHASIARIEQIQKEEDIDCDFRRLDGFLFPAVGRDPSELDKELKAGRQVGIPISDEKGLPLAGLEGSRCLRYGEQGTFHPLKYLAGLVRAIRARKGELYANSAVEHVAEKASGVIVKTLDGRRVHAAAAIVCTNSPINDRFALHTKQAPYRTYAMAFELPRGALPDALYWDTLDAYHYVRLQPWTDKTDILIAGGGDHKSGESDDGVFRFEAIEAWIRSLVPKLGRKTHAWSGQIMDTIDYTSFTGRNPGNEHVYVHTGDSGQGITHGVVASLIFASLIVDGRHRWSDVYEPSRKTLRGAGTFVTENLTVAKNFAEYVAPGELDSLVDLQPGCGAIVRQGLRKIAAYRDEDGKLYARSAACTHLGCHLHWNSLERCWDCPCHGSQFAVDGSVLNAPAIFPLAEVEVAAAGKRRRAW
jgi:glycine/D-amino acid oxidase-like deaminating enzyme/nitrite reductase/ring-hydroxylating ferredoxin subunit